MRKSSSFLSLLSFIFTFFLLGIFYLSLFASQSKILAVACQTSGPANNYESWCALNEARSISCIGAPSCGTNPTREDSYNMCVNCCYSTGQFSGYNLCVAAPTQAPPSCSSQGGYCQYYTAGCGAAGTKSGASCGSTYLTCCNPSNNCEAPGVAGKCVGASSGGVSPCPSGMNYDTSISCGSFYLVCCKPSSPPAQVPPPPPTYSIYGTVYIDTYNNGGNDGRYSGLTVTLRGSSTWTRTTNSNGYFSFSGFQAGTYTLSISVPSGYTAKSATSTSVTIGGSKNVNFFIVPRFSITGSVFNDVDKDYIKDANEGKTWSTNASFSRNPTTGNAISVNASAGTFSITDLYAGTYTITYTGGLPTGGYIYRHPLNGPPQTYSVTVGPGCTFSPQHPNAPGRATCNGRGDLSNLNFVLTNSIPWFQTYGFNIRLDAGFTNKIPSSPWYLTYASVANDETGLSDFITPTPTSTPAPAPTNTPVPTATPIPETGEGVSCNANGHAGVCRNRSTTACGTYYDAGWYCPGDDSVQCCVNSQVGCSGGTCHNRYNYPSNIAPGPYNGNTYSCSGYWATGLCPGPNDVQCCNP